MKQTSDDRFLGIAVVAGLFGMVGAGMLHVAWGFGFSATIGFFILIATVVAVVLAIGWSDASAAPPQMSAPAPAPAAAPTAPPPPPEPEPEIVYDTPGVRPEALDGPRDGRPDNLQEIKGIGPALEKLCNSLGFYHFDQVAAWTGDEVAWVDQNLEGFKGRVTRDKWVEQAKTLSSGGSSA